MRQVGTIATESDAKKLADYLLTLGITSRLDSTPEGWAVWVHREELVDDARRELQGFLEDPAATKYSGVEQVARAVRKQKEQEERRHLKNTIDLRGRRSYRPLGRCPLTFGLIVASVIVFVVTSWNSESKTLLNHLLIDEARFERVFTTDEEGQRHFAGFREVPSTDLELVRRGQVWRLVTPIFVHFGILHLVFNMMVLYDLGGMIEMRRGTVRLGLLVLATAVASNLGQYYYSHQPNFGGMSGVVYGLFGYVWMKSRYDPGSGLVLHPNTVNYMLIWLVLCMVGVIPHVANAAHVVGLAAGMLIGVAPHLFDEFRR